MADTLDLGNPELSAFPADSKVPSRLATLLSPRPPKFVLVKMSEAGQRDDLRRTQLADFVERHGLSVYLNPFTDTWSISHKGGRP